MKKAKIMLTVIAIMGIVGGALAFKAKRGAVIYCATASNLPCNAIVFDRTINPLTTLESFGYCSTTSLAVPCPVRRLAPLF